MKDEYQKNFRKFKRYLIEIEEIDNKINELKAWRNNRRKKIDETIEEILKEVKEDN